MASLLCPHCGTPNRSGSNFCNRCGAALHIDASGAPGAPLPDAPLPDVTPPSSPAGEGAAESARPGDQPWLEPGFIGEDDVPFEDDDELAALDDLAPLPAPASRLVSGVQGLLDPIRVATIPQEDAGASTGQPATAPSFTAEQNRRVRALMMEEPIVASSMQTPPPSDRSLWLPWVFLILGISVAAPLLLGRMLPVRTPMLWSGVESSVAAIERLETGARVQLLWAYDPATAGEMDMLSAPVLRHLLDRGATIDAISLLPNGPASARRLLASVETERLPDLTALGVRRTLEVRFLPGGATILPLIAAEPADLAIIFAAQAEDVQQWLELVAPVNRAPVVAVTAAGADPPLRAYVESGQLSGLISGFDGAYHYAELTGTPLAPDAARRMNFQLAGQSVGALAIITLIVLGNLASLLVGRRQDG